MSLRVQYLRDPQSPDTECWIFPAFTQDVEHADVLARDAFKDAQTWFGARCFRILNREGVVLSTHEDSVNVARPCALA